MNNPPLDNTLTLLKVWEDRYKLNDKLYDQLNEVLGLNIEGNLWECLFATFDLYTEALAAATNIPPDDLFWHLYDNECGKKQLEANNGKWKKSRKIKNIDDFYQLIKS